MVQPAPTSMAKAGAEGYFHNFGLLDASGGDRPAVLVLGGSTFMGRETVQALLALPARVCVVNRGRRYWGTEDPSGGRVARVNADRQDAASFAARLDEATKRLGGRWALVADFSAYNGADIRASLAGLQGRFETYVYISSDSVYEVSAWAGALWKPKEDAGGAVLVAEESSARPEDAGTRKRLKKADGYGDGKLEAEEALAEGLRGLPGSRAVMLRLPDVIGPWDDTLRLWAYWHWLRAGAEDPPQIRAAPAKRQRREPNKSTTTESSAVRPPLAFVFSRDVARFIVSLLGAPPRTDAGLADAVNLACLEQLPLEEMLAVLARCSGLATPLTLAETEKPKSFLPSVERPWPLCCRKMVERYGFSPTPIEEVLKSCADWFAQACLDFPEEAAHAAMKLPATARNAALQRASLPTPRGRSSSESSDSD